MHELKDAVLCQVHAAFNAGAGTLQIKALAGMPPWRLPPVTTDAGDGTYGKPFILLTLMDVTNQAAAKIEIIRGTFSGVDTGGGVYEVENCERGMFGTTDQSWDPGCKVMQQVSAAHVAMEMETAVARAQVLMTHPANGTVFWDGTDFKWSRFRIVGAGRGPHWSSDGEYLIDLPAPTSTAVGHGGASDVDFDANGIAIPVDEALYYELPIGEDKTSLDDNFRLVGIGSDFVVPKHWLLIAVHESDASPAADSVLRLGNGVTLQHWREIGGSGQPAFTNGWGNFGGSFETAAFMKTADGLVQLKGLVSAGTVGQAMFTLPVGYRPMLNQLHSVISNDAMGRLNINADGTVIAVAPANNAYVSLEGITFRFED